MLRFKPLRRTDEDGPVQTFAGLLMPVFARRRLQSMLTDLEPVLGKDKARDLLNRLEDKRVEQVLPAEMELALLWAIARCGEFEAEPYWWGDTRRPDAYTETLFAGRPTAVEIAAPNDNSASGEDAMDKIALQICAAASAAEKNSGDFLYFRFESTSGYEHGRYFRRRLAPEALVLSAEHSAQVLEWVSKGSSLSTRLRLQSAGLDVEIERTTHRQTRFHNIWSSMPPEVHSLEDNPLFPLLRRKARQLRAAQTGTLRMILLADAGSELLHRIGTPGEIDPTRRRVSGREIINHFLDRYGSKVDAVVVLAARRDQGGIKDRKLRWAVNLFSRRPDGSTLLDGLEKLSSFLPPPRFEGYQARSLFRQGAYSPTARGWYLGMTVKGAMTTRFEVRVPSRALVDLLAGRISEEQFRRYAGDHPGQKNLFANWLDMGLTLSAVQMSPREIDEDDDHLVLHFSDDPAARPLSLRRDEQD